MQEGRAGQCQLAASRASLPRHHTLGPDLVAQSVGPGSPPANLDLALLATLGVTQTCDLP